MLLVLQLLLHLNTIWTMRTICFQGQRLSERLWCLAQFSDKQTLSKCLLKTYSPLLLLQGDTFMGVRRHRAKLFWLNKMHFPVFVKYRNLSRVYLRVVTFFWRVIWNSWFIIFLLLRFTTGLWRVVFFQRSLSPFLYKENDCLGSQRINVVIFDRC